MKTLVGKAALAAAFVGMTSLGSFAQNATLQPGMVNRSIERLTLLPGPNLLSPARTTPTMAPPLMKLGATPLFYSMPFSGSILGGSGSTYIPLFSGSSSSAQPADVSTPVVLPGARPSPEFLRFNSTLDTAIPPGRFQFKAGPRI